MDATDDHNDPILDESQPSQLIQNVLHSGGIIAGRNASVPNRNLGDFTSPKDASFDSPGSAIRGSNSAPRYHYHGLAATQSHSQHHDGYEENQGSQKENISTPNTSGESRQLSVPSTNTRQTSPHISSSLGTHIKEQFPQGGQSSSPLCATTKSKAMAAPTMPILLQPAIKPAMPKDDTLHSRIVLPQSTRLQQVQDFSQDSFAGPISQDLEREFLASNKKFEIPLSELGRVSYSQESQVTPFAADSGQPSSEHTEMFALPGRGGGANRKPPSNHGRVLVAATPSNSGSSQSQDSQPSQPLGISLDSQLFNNRQPMDVYDEPVVNDDGDARSEASTQEYASEPSSSYERLLAGEPEPIEQIDNATSYEATQPSTQPEDLGDDIPEGAENILTGQKAEWGTGSHRDTNLTSIDRGQHQGPSDNPVAPSDNSSAMPRSIISMVNPRKKWRINRHEEIVPTPAKPTPSEEGEQNMTSETQPSFESSGQDREQMNVRLRPQLRHEVAWPARKQPLPSSNDNMEIVPDSEPAHSEHDRPLMALSAGSNTLPQVVFPASPSKNDMPLVTQPMDSRDIVPDSVIDDADDDDTPLAVLTAKHSPVKRTSARGKAKAPTSRAGGRRPLEMVTSGPVSKQKRDFGKPALAHAGQHKRQTSVPRSGGSPLDGATITEGQGADQLENNLGMPDPSWDTSVVPSSIPEQDLCGLTPVPVANAKPSAPKTTTKGKAKVQIKSVKATIPAASTSDRKTRSRSTSTNPTKKRRIASDSYSASSYQPGPISKPVKEEEEETEPADEDYMVVDDDEDFGPSSRKRKRGNAKADTRKMKKVSKIATRASKKSDTTLVPAKRTRSMSTGPGTRVFAFWRQDNHYYSGYVHSHVSGSKYLIRFDDGTDDEVEMLRLRRNGLRIGDNVILITKRGEKAKVVDDECLEIDDAVVVEMHDGEELARSKVPLSDIRIAARTISSQWKDRILTADTIETMVKSRSLKSTPSLSKLSVISGGSTRSKALSKFGLAVTLTPGLKDWEDIKDKLIHSIQNHGGTVIDDWFTIIRMDGKYSSDRKRWTMRAEDVIWAGKASLQRVFLLADDASQKPKYLIALALGIPCLSIDWLRNFVNSGDPDWQPYLLPQGCSTALEARVSQFVDLDWCNSPEHLDKIMDNKVASKVFKGKSILCLSADFIPGKSGKNASDADKSREAWSAVPRVVIAMGAARVEAAVDVDFASKEPSRYDYVIIKDQSEFKRHLSEVSGVTCVSFQWVKECLIAGQLVPFLEW